MGELFKYDTIEVGDLQVLKKALALYSKRKLDFVDALLFAYSKVRNYKVCTFDKKLDKLLNE